MSKVHIAEKGCCLVTSFGINGTVMILIYPYKSERHSMKEENIILYSELHPEKITKTLINRCISSFLFYSRFTSIYGLNEKINLIDQFKYYFLIIKDIRNRKKITRTIASTIYDWSKIVAAGLIGYLVAILTK